MRMGERPALETRSALRWGSVVAREQKGKRRERGTEGKGNPNKSKICRRRDVHAGTCTLLYPGPHVRLGAWWLALAGSAQLNRPECPRPCNAALDRRNKGHRIQTMGIRSNPRVVVASPPDPIQSVEGGERKLWDKSN